MGDPCPLPAGRCLGAPRGLGRGGAGVGDERGAGMDELRALRLILAGPRPKDGLTPALRLVERRPELPGAWALLSDLWLADARPDRSAEAVELGLRLHPASVELLSRKARALLTRGASGEALVLLQRALQVEPENASLHVNLGLALRGIGALPASIAALREGLTRAAPRSALQVEADWNLALALRMAGEEREGLERYEARLQLPKFSLRPLPGPVWRGEPLRGRTLVIVAEQGLGDTLQHIYLLRHLAERTGGARPFLAVQPPLMRLLAGQDAQLLSLSPALPAGLPEGYCWCPLLSLPLRLGLIEPAARAQATAWIQPEPALKQRWAERLAALRRPGARLVGLVYQGNPAYAGDAERSVPLRHFQRLARDPSLQLVSLQKVHGLEQHAAWPAELPLLDLGPELDEHTGAFCDTAAVMSELDVIVSSDTSALHLAGALFRPTHGLLAAVPDWRFGLRGQGAPEVPHTRLHRQRRPGDWEGVVAELHAALRAPARGPQPS